jgi:2-polyprenyl-3-methyl-5-hydroxy-6-metoxy-1,4-benzoquinol methylase
MDTEILKSNGHAVEAEVELEKQPDAALNGATNSEGAGEDEETVYVFAYNKRTPYYKVVELAQRYIAPGSIVDLGAGAGTLGQPLQESGFSYTGLEMSKGGLKLMNQRGLRNFYCDLTDLERLEQLLEESSPVRAFCLMDVLEHLEHPERLLTFLADYARSHQSPYLLVSVPNVGHRDVVYNLLAGKWETTEAGILDKTHLRFFTRNSLHRLLTENGWQVVTENNFEREQADEYDPDSVLHTDTQLGDLLRYVSDTFNPDNKVNQFIWLLKPQVESGTAHEEKDLKAENKESKALKRPLVSMLVRTQGQRNDLLIEALYSIFAQDCPDYEVIICFHAPGSDEEKLLSSLYWESEDEDPIHNPFGLKDPNVRPFREMYRAIDKLPVEFRPKIRVIICNGEGRSAPLNTLLEAAEGEYLSFLDDDDLLFPRHISVIKKAVEEHGKNNMFQTFAAQRKVRVLEHKKSDYGFNEATVLEPRPPKPTFPYTVEAIEPTWTTPFNPLTQQYGNSVPITCFIMPRKLVEQTNLRFRTDFEVSEDWEFWMRVSQFLKVTTLPEITAAINLRTNGTNTVGHEELSPAWQIHHKKRLEWQAQHPLILDGRTAGLLYRQHIRDLIKQELQNKQMQELSTEYTEKYEKDYRELEKWAHSLNERLQKITGSRLYRLIGRFLR